MNVVGTNPRALEAPAAALWAFFLGTILRQYVLTWAGLIDSLTSHVRFSSRLSILGTQSRVVRFLFILPPEVPSPGAVRAVGSFCGHAGGEEPVEHGPTITGTSFPSQKDLERNDSLNSLVLGQRQQSSSRGCFQATSGDMRIWRTRCWFTP